MMLTDYLGEYIGGITQINKKTHPIFDNRLSGALEQSFGIYNIKLIISDLNRHHASYYPLQQTFSHSS